MGSRMEDGTFTGTLPQILSLVGLNPKFLLRDGESDPEVMAAVSDKVVGHLWDCTQDMLSFKFKVNLSPKTRTGDRKDADLTLEDLPRLAHLEITMRRLLGWINSLYDPSGLLSPVTIRLKLLYRKIIAREYGELSWDDQLPPAAHQEWERVIEEFLKMPEVRVPRAVRPKQV